MDDSSLEKKQEYLKKEILDGGLDAEMFMSYMGVVKDQGEEIKLQNWTLAEITKLVFEFKDMCARQKNQENREKKKKMDIVTPRETNPVKKQSLEHSIKKNSKVLYDFKNWWFLEMGSESSSLWDYEIQEKKKCKKSRQMFKFIEQPKIQFLNYSVKKTGGLIFGMGNKNQLVMTFKTNFTDSAVTRTSDDIIWLRNNLCAKFTGSFIPPYESATSVNPQESENSLRLSHSAQFFLNSLLQYDYLIHNNFFFQFIAQSDNKKFTDFKDQSGITRAINSFEQVERMEGFSEVEISQRLLDFVKQTSSYTEEVQKQYKNAQTNILRILQDMEILAKDFDIAAKDFTKIYHKHKKMAETCKIQGNRHKQQQKISNTYRYLTNIFTKMQEQQKQSILILRQFSQDLVSNIHQELSEFKTYQNDYLSKHNNYLLNKKSSSNSNEQSKTWQAYLNNMYQKSFRTLMKHQEKVCVKHFGAFCYDMDQMHETHSKVFEKFHEMVVP